MEMYADEKARGGVLEPEGIVEIKFRKPQMLACMERLDDTVRALRQKLADPELPPAERAEAKRQLDAREKELLPVYTQMAVQFADLHDRAGRMVAKGVVRQELSWASSRAFFYYRLRRRLLEEPVCRALCAAAPDLSRQAALATVAEWFAAAHPDAGLDYGRDDRAVAAWFDGAADDIAAKLAAHSAAMRAAALSASLDAAEDDAVAAALQALSPERRAQLLARLGEQ
ncbi:acetyl-coenzyme-A carboxylase [Coemansia sp. BCRC 34490]|nr:acetyl-coenzyme-A carboxylase [Coemansia sp. BCRC 34490]